jgi:hypothetical protein
MSNLIDYLSSYLHQNIQTIIIISIISLFIIDYFNYKFQSEKQFIYTKKRLYKLECKFDEVTKHMKDTRNQMELENNKKYSSIQTYIMDIEKQIKFNNNNQDSLVNLAKSLDSCLINDNQLYQSKLSIIEEKLIIVFSDEINKLEERLSRKITTNYEYIKNIQEKFMEYIQDTDEQTKSIYYFFKTGMLHKTFNGEVSFIEIIDSIFDHYYEINFDEEKDCINKKLIIDSLPIITKKRIENKVGIQNADFKLGV